MEALLLEKTRNLEHQLTTSRLRLAEASGKRPLLPVICSVT